MQQGRQECRPSDGPATLLSPMVGMEICFFPSVPKLVLVGGLSRNSFCKSLVGLESCFFPSVPKLVLVGGLLRNTIRTTLLSNMRVVSFGHGQNPILGRGLIGNWI